MPEMTPERFARLSDVYRGAARLGGREQQAYLSTACTGDPSLESEVRELLAIGEPDDTEIDAFVSGVAQDLTEEMAQASVVERIGPYRVIGALGHGGMGRVWLAERADGHFEQRVAIKLVDGSRAAPELVMRFRSERQILANLDHPNIARLFDGGETDEGVPYLVMEYVDGVPVDRYCDEARLPIRERLELFMVIAAAVEYAHRNLVVHRDIKPSNVLVTADGVPKLLDFGIAKLLDTERARALELHETRDVSRLLTPATASPEQLRGEPVTTAADVYQLGHLLYRLLTGAMPHDADTSDRFLLPRAILEDEPKRPSAAAWNDGAAAAVRGTTPERLSRRLAGDLDAIVLKALRKTPGERYAAPRELAGDLERHLAGLPVQARGERVGYVARRFITRHRGAIAASASALVLIASLITYYTVELAVERDRAQSEARRAQEVATFLGDLFEVATPDESRGSEITAREILDRGAERIGVELGSQPAVRASLMRVIGSAYGKLGLYEKAAETLEQALGTREALGGEADALLGDALHDLGVVLLIDARYSEAEALLERALSVRREVHGPVHANVASTLLSLASLAQETADYERVAATVDEAEAIVQQIEPVEPQLLADLRLARGDLYNSLGDFDAAIDNYRQSATLRTEVLGEDHPATLWARDELSTALANSGRAREAEAILRENLEVRRRVLPPDHPGVAQALMNLSTTLKMQGRSGEAVPYQEQALEILRAAHAGDHPDVATALNNLANLRHDLRDLETALALHQASLDMNRRLYGDNHPSLAYSYNNLAALQADRGEFESALKLYERTLELDSRHLGDDHPYVGFDRVALGSTLGQLGRIEEAEATLREALAHNRRISGDDHPYTFNALRELGRLLVHEDRCAEAEPLLAEALPGLEHHYPGQPWEVAVTRSYLGACRAVDRPSEGELLMRRGYERLVELQGPHSRFAVQARHNLLEFLRANGRDGEARALERAAARVAR